MTLTRNVPKRDRSPRLLLCWLWMRSASKSAALMWRHAYSCRPGSWARLLPAAMSTPQHLRSPCYQVTGKIRFLSLPMVPPAAPARAQVNMNLKFLLFTWQCTPQVRQVSAASCAAANTAMCVQLASEEAVGCRWVEEGLWHGDALL